MAAHMTEDLREDLLARWAESHRRHHNVAHLNEMLDAIGVLADDGLEFDREAVELAAWFHDSIYVIGADDNEDRSAELARQLLASSAVRDEVARLVLATKSHKVIEGDVRALCAVMPTCRCSAAIPVVIAPTPMPCGKITQRFPMTSSNPPGRKCLRRYWPGPSSTPKRAARGGRKRRGAMSPTR